MSPTLALLAKATIPPVLVAVMSMAARRWGATIGGLILGLPWMTGPLLYFLGLEKGPDFLIGACRGVELAVWSMGAFILCFGYAAGRVNAAIAVGLAVAGFFACAVATQYAEAPVWVCALIASGVLFVTLWLLPKPTTSAVPGPLPWWDIPARMLATFGLVCSIIALSDVLGPQRSGVAASFPVVVTVIGSFTLYQWGRDALLRVLRGISQSLQAFVGFFAVVGMSTRSVGQTAAYGMAVAIALAISAGLIALNGRRVRG